MQNDAMMNCVTVQMNFYEVAFTNIFLRHYIEIYITAYVLCHNLSSFLVDLLCRRHYLHHNFVSIVRTRLIDYVGRSPGERELLQEVCSWNGSKAGTHRTQAKALGWRGSCRRVHLHTLSFPFHLKEKSEWHVDGIRSVGYFKDIAKYDGAQIPGPYQVQIEMTVF